MLHCLLSSDGTAEQVLAEPQASTVILEACRSRDRIVQHGACALAILLLRRNDDFSEEFAKSAEADATALVASIVKVADDGCMGATALSENDAGTAAACESDEIHLEQADAPLELTIELCGRKAFREELLISNVAERLAEASAALPVRRHALVSDLVSLLRAPVDEEAVG